jgi:ATP diphosphatase
MGDFQDQSSTPLSASSATDVSMNVPHTAQASAADIMPLARIMARLRDPQTGCPWDIEQDFATIAPYTIEEAYEVADAIQRGDMAALKDELGDLLLQTVFHARMAEQAGHFALHDVIEGICAKMVRRHPHVFGDVEARDGVTAQVNWETIKAAERAEKKSDPSALAGVAVALPALLRAEKLQKRAARTGFDWPDTEGVIAKIHEEIAEVESAQSPADREEEIGDLLFAVVNLARHHKIDPETALRSANGKFEKRFRAMEELAGDGFAALSLEDKERLWQAVKRA